MHIVTVVGIILVALGTGLMYWGSQIQSRKDSTETTTVVEGKIQEVMSAFQKAGTEVDSDSVEKIEAIESEFRTWARDFLSNRQSRKLAFDSLTLQSTEEELQLSGSVRPIFEQFLIALRGLIASYNQVAGTKFEANLPPLSENLYTSDYNGYIKFDETAGWHVSIFTPLPAKENALPTLYVEFCRDNQAPDLIKDSRMGLSYRKIDERWHVYISGNDLPANAFPGRISSDKISAEVPKLAETLFEAQLHILSGDQ